MKPVLYLNVLLVLVSTVCTDELAFPVIYEEDVVGSPQVVALPQPADISPQRFEYTVFIDCMKKYGNKVVVMDEARKLLDKCGSNLACLNSKGAYYKNCALFSYYIDSHDAQYNETLTSNINSNMDLFFNCLIPRVQLLPLLQKHELLINAYYKSIFFCKEDPSCLHQFFSDILLTRFNDCWLDYFGGLCELRGGLCADMSKKRLCRKSYPKASGCGKKTCCRVEFNHQCTCHYGGVSKSGNISLAVTDWCIPWKTCVKKFNKYYQVQVL